MKIYESRHSFTVKDVGTDDKIKSCFVSPNTYLTFIKDATADIKNLFLVMKFLEIGYSTIKKSGTKLFIVKLKYVYYQIILSIFIYIM